MNVTLLIIDPQVDFHPGGSLAVQGANEDSERIANLIRSQGGKISKIVITLDSHHRTHIAHGISWENSSGEHPSPFTLISHEEAKAGVLAVVETCVELLLLAVKKPVTVKPASFSVCNFNMLFVRTV